MTSTEQKAESLAREMATRTGLSEWWIARIASALLPYATLLVKQHEALAEIVRHEADQAGGRTVRIPEWFSSAAAALAAYSALEKER